MVLAQSGLSLIVFLYVFVVSAILDVVWALAVRRANQGKAFQSATLSSFITILGGVIVIEYTDNYLYLIPAAIGGFIGNYFAVKLDLHKRNKKRRHK